MKSLLALLLLVAPAWAGVDFTKQYRLPCGQCHIDGKGAGVECLFGKWNKNKNDWDVPPKPMEECSWSQGGELTPFGVMFHRSGDKFQP